MMETFGSVIGHKEIIGHLQSAIRLGKVSHAYMFCGEDGAGKNLLASIFAAALQCQGEGEKPCGSCGSCRKAESGNHPDIIRVIHEKPASIGIEEVRSQLVGDVTVKPYSGPYKVYIIDEAEKLTVQAQNSILKTIEEPPAYAVILLLTSNAEALLPTISSRCVKLKLKAVSDAMIKNYLIDTCRLPDYQAEMDAAFAQGNVGKARKIAMSEEFSKTREYALRILKYSKDMPMQDLVETMKRLAQEKETIYDYLDFFLMWFRDVLLFKATWEVDGLVFKQEINAIRERAQSSSYEGLEKIINAIDKAKSRLHANVNFDLTMELLFLTIREN